MAKPRKGAKKAVKRSTAKRAARKSAAKRAAPKRVAKKASVKRSAGKAAKKTTAARRKAPQRPKTSPAASVSPNVCDDFNASQGSEVNFVNPSATTTCNITAVSGSTWPFTDGPPIAVPPGGYTTYIKSAAVLPDGTYTYDVDCCADQTQKSVTVP